MRPLIITLIVALFSINSHSATNENLHNWKKLIGHELVFPQSNQSLYKSVYKPGVLKKKQFDNKKYYADIDIQDIPVVLKDVQLLTVNVSQNVSRDLIYLIITVHGIDVVVPSMKCYDKTEIDQLNSRYKSVFLLECPVYKNFNGTFLGIEYDKSNHQYYLLSDNENKLWIEPSIPHKHHKTFDHDDHYPSHSLCAIREALEYGISKSNLIKQKHGNLIRY